jgi:hypothetical protein
MSKFVAREGQSVLPIQNRYLGSVEVLRREKNLKSNIEVCMYKLEVVCFFSSLFPLAVPSVQRGKNKVKH